MTANGTKARASVPDAGAPVRDVLIWDQSDWFRIEHAVRRLQVRIAKAAEEGRWGKVKALQHLLTRSQSGKILAVKRVTENRGKNMIRTAARSDQDRSKGLSRMRGDSHVRF